jgi:hypothetical protein
VATQSPSVLQWLGHPGEAAVHRYGKQSVVAAGEQVPVPEQDAACTNSEPEQVAPAQPVLLETCAQLPAPSHRPLLPQVPLAAHWPLGAGDPAAIGAQVPVPVMLQAWQLPQPLVEQQTPSIQLPLPHSWPVPQAAPRPFWAAQLPPEVDVQ